MCRTLIAFDMPLPAGTEVHVGFPDAHEALVARVARAEHGVIALFFRQDRTPSERIDQVLDGSGKQAQTKAA
jgi:hypothetical protein